jgi:hypothetical protein
MNRAAIWELSLFCKFYGRIIPENQDQNGCFSRFHTSTRNPDIDDLDVSFNEKLEPMNFNQLLILSRGLFVIGHGDSWNDYGRVFFEKYTLFSREQIKQLHETSIKFFDGNTLESFFESGQAVITNCDDYFKAATKETLEGLNSEVFKDFDSINEKGK